MRRSVDGRKFMHVAVKLVTGGCMSLRSFLHITSDKPCSHVNERGVGPSPGF
jgi:hypothetical protein